MRLNSFRFNSVKSFDEPQHLGIKDLTLIYGANSSGKSSILQTLLLMKQSADLAHSADSGVVEFRGGSVDLGGFRTFVHGHDVRRSIDVEMTLDVHDRDESAKRSFFDQKVTLALQFGLPAKEFTEPIVQAVILADGQGTVSFSYSLGSNALEVDLSRSAGSIVDRFCEVRKTLKTDTPNSLSDGDVRWLKGWVRTHACEQHGWLPYWSPRHLRTPGEGRSSSPGAGIRRAKILNEFIYLWYNWTFSFAQDLVQSLNSIVYIGPLRDFPRRVAAEASDAVGLGIRGERLVLTLARKPELVDLVNRAFTELEIPYILKVEQVRSEKIQDALGDVAVAVLTDRRTGLTVSPADVGFGLSQILPVVVQLLANTDSIILIEQPEIHLHPKMQSRLADLLIISAVSGKNRIIVETHSEHLLFRAQRRLREGSFTGFRTDSLGVYFVSSLDGKGSVQRLRLAPNGEMLDPWPDGFFDDRIDDLFAGL